IVDGTDIWAKPKNIRAVRFRVGMVFQYPEHQLFEETVRRDIAFGPTNMGLAADEIEARVKKAASFVGLRDELLDASPFDLSGGEKRRVAIAGVMAMEPDILVLDEPTAGLDPRGREQLLDQIATYRRRNGTTVLLVSHSMNDVAAVCNKVLVMNDGEAAMFGETAAIFSRAEELEAMGLSVPSVTRILMGLRAKGFDVGENVYTVDQAVARLLPLLRKGGGVC
ncbi:MAG: energy-coupling factor transporter ATPase, partial [Clostridia bacterium]|nr:energy-coupling factor transporter ATPase [Clostridia bacterium]